MVKRMVISFYLLLFGFCLPSVLSAEESSTPSGIAINELEAFVDDYVNAYIGETVAGAAIVVLKDQEIVLSKGYGYADLENQIPMEPDTTILEWGSISKLFVWVSAMQLVEQGKLDLEEDIRSYLPEGFLSNVDDVEPITTLHLMHHNAGFEDNIFDLLFDSPKHLVPLEEALKVAEPEQVYQPGEVVAYSNYSTSLAAYMIEQITGQPFDEYVEEHILEKLGMQHSTIHFPSEDNQVITSNKEKGYFTGEKGEFIPSPPFYMSLYPSGGMNGTTTDLAKFAQTLLLSEAEGSPLFQNSQTLSELLSTSYTAQEGIPGIAHGFWEYQGKYRGLTHSGNTVAYSSNMQMVPEDHFAAIVLTNQADELDLTFGLMDKLVGEGDQSAQDKLPSAFEVEGSYLSARRTYSGLMNLYAYLTPLRIQARNENEIELDVAGFKADFVQTSPYVYQLKSGDNAFLPSSVMYFHVVDGKVEQISTSYADYLPNDKNDFSLFISLFLFIWCLLYFVLAPIVLIIRAWLRWRRKKQAIPIIKWNWLLTLSGTALSINMIVLAIRMLSNPMRASSELFIHFIGNYLFTGSSVIGLVLLLINWKKTKLTKMQKAGYLLTCVSSILFIAWLISWELYAL